MSVSLRSAVLAATVVSIGYLLSRLVIQRRSNLPPGPRRWPLIGSVLEMPQSHQWVTFSNWAKTYGRIVYLEALGQPLIVINSAKVAKDLMDQHFSIYSDRPHLAMAELSGYVNLFVLQSYGDNWRQQRKIVAQDFGPSAVRQYYPLQEAEARKLVHGLVVDSTTLAGQIRLRIGTIIIRVTYGHYINGEQDPFLTSPLTAMDNFSQATAPGVWFVDLLPALKNIPSWIPGTGFLQVARQWRKLVMDTTWNPYRWSKKNLESGTVLLPNLCANNIEASDGKLSEEQEERLVWAACSMMGGGMDTNISSVLTFFLAMMLNPSVQAKARQEIEAVIGSDRLPVIQDRASLPYVRSIMTEVFRWQPAVPLALPHALRQDDVYEGMHLPKGSLIIPNVWHMLHDPEVYQNPMKFDPNRFQGLNSEMDKVTDVMFGFGRRACPGRDFAEGTFFAIVSTVLATCDILPVLDAGGNEVLPDVSYSSGTISFPSTFKCNVKCRSQKALDLLSIGDSTEESK
ncbi:putative monooxygenase [Mycena galericulata]|nr:putative monooxygenase [Mycena galericulata]